MTSRPWSGPHVRAHFNGVPSVLYYARAAHFLGLWESEKILLGRFLPGLSTDILEAGCGAGRVTMGLWKLGYRRICAFDYAAELLDQARSLAREHHAGAIRFVHADATRVKAGQLGRAPGERFGAALFMFNGLMQIPGRRNRRAALRRLAALCLPGAPLLFTSHDRGVREEAAHWEAEARAWREGRQDPRLRDFGDRHFHDASGPVFIHIPDRAEILADLEATGWEPAFDAMRSQVAAESAAVFDFSDECRFWAATRGADR